MILEQLKLRNFCLYRGEQNFDLMPAKKNGNVAPIILFGGMNGGGKTTLLDAVQLVLYGSRAKCSRRAGRPYDVFLQECIHRDAKPSDGTSIGLRFRYGSEGREQVYDVRRTWFQNGKRVRETVEVLKDGEHDGWVAEHWNELVEELIPLGISQLFFFDAEQIRYLAEDETAHLALGGAVKSLLGLDLAEQLIADAGILESRLVERTSNFGSDSEVGKLKEKLVECESQLRPKKLERAGLENERLRAEEALRLTEEEFSRIGGEQWKQRQDREQKLSELSQREESLRSELVHLAGLELPMALVPELMASVEGQDEVERNAAAAAVVPRVLERRDKKILRALKEHGVSETAIAVVQKIQDSDRASRTAEAQNHPRRLALSDSGRALLRHLSGRGLQARRREARKLLEEFESARRNQEEVARALEATPDEGDVKEVAERLKITLKEFSVLNEKASRLDAEIRSLQLQRDEVLKKLRTLRRRYIDQEIESEEAARVANLAARTQGTMREFLSRATSEKIDRLSSLVTRSFRFLLRKRALVERVEIDPSSFRITLYDDSGRVVPKERLSEGEKQIFAISVLWGLAQASPRPLPAIIDTPMARLDAKHRSHLIERYFPNASHQVVVLSTDTEVDQNYYRALEPYISRAYHLNYCEKDKVTVGEEGYFWDGEMEEVA